jgi:pimeloyl-ACP methyl ester carboxylesterase
MSRGPDRTRVLAGGGTFHGFEFSRDWLRDFRVLLPYHPGFGESADAPSMYSLADYVGHYQALFDALGLKSLHLAGASLGGRLAAEFALLHPDRVRRLVLVAPGGIATPEPQPDYSRSGDDWPAYFTYDRMSCDSSGLKSLTGVPGRTRSRRLKSGRIARRGLEPAGWRVCAPTLLIWGKEIAWRAGNAPGWQRAFRLDSQDHRSRGASVIG